MNNLSNIWDPKKSVAELTRLSAQGVLGFYSGFEITEIFAIADADQAVYNVFTIAVAVEGDGASLRGTPFLSDKPVSLKSLPGWKFGVQRYFKTTPELISGLKDIVNGEWKLSGQLMKCGQMIAMPPAFVPPNSSERIPLNRVLKNNFWNGSHVFEWVDSEKGHLRNFFEEPKCLQELSPLINAWVPLELASLSDRLGNLIVQLSVTVVMTGFSKSQGADGLVVQSAWHSKATPRLLRVSCEVEWDKSLVGYASEVVSTSDTFLSLPDTQGTAQGVVWDDENRVILAATVALHFIKTISLNITPTDPEPRLFAVPQKDGTNQAVTIQLQSQGISSHIGAPLQDPAVHWTQRRIYDEELARLLKERSFIQYLPNPNNQRAEHERALGHIRDLISQYGSTGAWLWDPFLDALDVLNTLAHCPHSNSDLRALTAAERSPCALVVAPSTGASTTAAGAFIDEQRAILDGIESNWRGLKLEFRAKHGQVGWAFHDRFLIFPQNKKAALVWSLGTSVNSLGKAHHILQKVDNGQMILEAFQGLWDALYKPECLVWEKP